MKKSTRNKIIKKNRTKVVVGVSLPRKKKCGLYWILVQSLYSLEGKVDKKAVATFYQVGWTDYTLQEILGQKF